MGSRVDLSYDLSEDPHLTVDGSRIWISFRWVEAEEWDFGAPTSSTILHYTELGERHHLDFVGGIRKERSFLPGIEDTITRKEVFRLPWGCAKPADAQWDGQFLVAGYDSGEVLILDFDHILHH